MARRVLVTGAEGFTGRYLAAAMASKGWEVHGLVYRRPDQQIEGIANLVEADLANAEAVQAAVESVMPSHVAHLAAIAFVAHGDIESIYRTNLVGTRHLLQALSTIATRPEAVLLASSANIYGNSTGGTIDEDTPPAPANDYAVSKLAMEYVARIYSDRVPTIVVRPFNYTGVGQSPAFLIPKIVEHVRRRAEVVELGNIDVARDFSDVRMVSDVYRRLLEAPKAIGKTLNVCSGRANTLQEVLDLVGAISGHRMEARMNPAFVRANEVKTLLGSRRLLESCIGPVRPYELSETLEWMLKA